jgi:putative membrane protein
MRKLRVIFGIVLFLALYSTTNLLAQIDLKIDNQINDVTKTLTKEEISILNIKLNEIEKSKNVAIALVMVNSVNAEDKEKYADNLLATWSNSAPNKVLILVAIYDRNLWLSSIGNDEIVKEDEDKIKDIIIPQFRSGRFLLGLNDGIDAIVDLNNGTDINNNSTFQLKNYPLLSILFILVLLSIFSGFVNDVKIKLVVTIVIAGLFWLAFGSITYSLLILILSLFTLLGRSSRGGGGAYGGGYSGGNEGAGGDNGESSFSLGGGAFGGGGASGDWRSFFFDTHKRFDFNDEQKQNVEQAVKDLELESSGEIVVYFARKSDSYQQGSWKLSVILGLLGLIAVISLSYLWMLPSAFSVMNIAMFVLILIILGPAITYFFPSVRLAFVPLNVMDHRVVTKARDVFLQEEIFNTIDRTGILIYVSELEKRVQVLGDKGISSVIQQDDWNKVLSMFTDGIKQGNPANGLVNAINECKHLLLANGFVVREDDTNELSDTMIIEE